MRKPEIHIAEHEFKAEKAPEGDICLDSLLSILTSRTHGDIDPVADFSLIVGVGNSLVSSNESKGLFEFACQVQGCPVDSVLVQRTPGIDGTFNVVDPNELADCLTA